MRTRDKQSNLTLIVRHFEANSNKLFTAYDVAALLRITPRNARPYMKILHDKRTVYIESYLTKPTGPAVPRYRFNPYGDNEDAPYPGSKPRAERMKRIRLFKRISRNASIAT